MNCAGSVKKIGDESSSAGPEAMKGTGAHKVIETMMIDGETDSAPYKGKVCLVHKPGTEDTIICKADDKIIATKVEPDSGWFLFPIDDDMLFGVQMFVDEVERVRAELDTPDLYTERYLDMTWLDSRLGGTADTTLVEFLGWIHLFDYKNGRVVVDHRDNDQLKQYAVGLLHEHSECLGVVCHLIQPNAAHEEGQVRPPVAYSADELKLYEIQMKEAADATSAPNAALRAGDWCTYCPANTRCEEFDGMIAVEAGVDFNDDPLLAEPVVPTDNTELARRMKFIPIFDGWKRNMLAQAMAEMVGGRSVPGCKLVRGRSNRKWSPNPETAKAALIAEHGLDETLMLTEPELKSPAQLEKAPFPGLKKKVLKDIVETLTVRPPGKIAVAFREDPREEVDPNALAGEDFANDALEGDESDFGV